MEKAKRVNACILMMAMAGLICLGGCSNTGGQTAAPGQKEEAVSEGTPDAGPEGPSAQEVTAGEETEDGTAGVTEAAGAAGEYAPNREYDKYALVDYTIEDIMAQFTATVSAKEDGSEYELHCSVEGAEQLLVLDGDLNIVSDQTGDIANDAPAIVQKAIDEDKWTGIEK